MYDVKGKKLLIVGANGHSSPAVWEANDMGCRTIVINYDKRAMAKRFAAEAYEVDCYRPDEVLAFAKEHKIDGVFTGWNEVNIFTAEYVAKNLGLPFYGTKEQADMLVTKKAFKDTCRRFKVPVVPEYFCGGAESFTQEVVDAFSYPVIFKPTDSGGTRGMTIIDAPSAELAENGFPVNIAAAYEKAMDASIEKKIIVEKYLKDTKLIVMDFAVQNGEPYLVCVADRITVREHKDRVPLGFCFMYPSVYIDMVEEQVLDSLKELCRGIGLKNCIISFEGMISGGKLYVIECQFRYGGTHMDRFVKANSGVNLMQMSVEFALTGRFDSWDLSKLANPRFKRTYSCQNLQMGPGRISSVEGLEEVRSMAGVDWIVQQKDIGDFAPDDGSTARNFAKIGLSGGSRAEVYRLIDKIQRSLVIRDENGKNMVIQNVPKELMED